MATQAASCAATASACQSPAVVKLQHLVDAASIFLLPISSSGDVQLAQLEAAAAAFHAFDDELVSIATRDHKEFLRLLRWHVWGPARTRAALLGLLLGAVTTPSTSHKAWHVCPGICNGLTALINSLLADDIFNYESKKSTSPLSNPSLLTTQLLVVQMDFLHAICRLLAESESAGIVDLYEEDTRHQWMKETRRSIAVLISGLLRAVRMLIQQRTHTCSRTPGGNVATGDGEVSCFPCALTYTAAYAAYTTAAGSEAAGPVANNLPPPCDKFAMIILSAVAVSGVLEHCVRGLMLHDMHLPSPAASTAAADSSSSQQQRNERRMSRGREASQGPNGEIMEVLHEISCLLITAGRAGDGITSDPICSNWLVVLRNALRAIMSGPNVQYVMADVIVTHLVAADGGTSYGRSRGPVFRAYVGLVWLRGGVQPTLSADGFIDSLVFWQCGMDALPPVSLVPYNHRAIFEVCVRVLHFVARSAAGAATSHRQPAITPANCSVYDGDHAPLARAALGCGYAARQFIQQRQQQVVRPAGLATVDEEELAKRFWVAVVAAIHGVLDLVLGNAVKGRPVINAALIRGLELRLSYKLGKVLGR